MQIVANVMNEVSIRDFLIFVFVVSGAQYMVYVTDESLVNNNYSLCASNGASTTVQRNFVLSCSRPLTGKIIEIHAPPHIPLKIYEVSLMCKY